MKRFYPFLLLALLAGCTEPSVTQSPGDSEPLGRLESAPVEGESAHEPGAASKQLTFISTAYGVDMATAGVGAMRDTPGPHDITISGINGPVKFAMLYWHGPTNTTDPAANAQVIFNGTAVAGHQIGFSSDNCWGYLNSQAYRANVTFLVSGDGTYSLDGFGSGAVNTNGASLVVFYDDGTGANDRDVVMVEGNDSNVPNGYDPNGWDLLVPGLNYTSGTAELELHVADGQGWIDDVLRVNGVDLFPVSNWLNGFTVPGKNDGPGDFGRLWDIVRTDITAQLAAAGPAPQSVRVQTGGVEDCLAAVLAIVDLPADAGPAPSESLDSDMDGVVDSADLCPFTVIPEGVPTGGLGVNRFALVDDDFTFDTVSTKNGPKATYTTADTGGCSCEQILASDGKDNGGGQKKFGCTPGRMDKWAADVAAGG